MENAMNALILVTLGCILVFIVIPAVVLTLYLTGHHEPDDFDIKPSMMDNTPYEAWREAILQNIERIREKTYASKLTSTCSEPGGMKHYSHIVADSICE